MASVSIIIVAAGSGLRFGSPLPKQFCLLGDRPVVMHTIDAFRSANPAATISIVISRDMAPLWNDLCSKHNFRSPAIVYGGTTRWESVRNAIQSLPQSDIIMIHDGVRPLVDTDLISRLTSIISDNKSVDGVIPAIPVTDSLRKINSNGQSKSIDRAFMRAVQTPQAFPSYKLRKAYSMPYRNEFTDDASVMEAAGFDNIVLTEGSPENIKITNPGDLALAEFYMKRSKQK